MKRLIVCLMVASFLAGTAVSVLADIPMNADYMVWYHKVEGVPTWEYLPGSSYYGLPYWDHDDLWHWWYVPNFHQEGFMKTVWYEVEWEQGYGPTMAPDLYLRHPYGDIWNVGWSTYNPENNSWTLAWSLGLQPSWEHIFWPNYLQYPFGSPEYLLYRNYYRWFYDLEHVTKIEIATLCVEIPEPGSMAAMVCGLGGLAGLALRRRK